MHNEKNCLSYWYPKIVGLVPTPKTIIVKTGIDLGMLLHDNQPRGLDAFLGKLKDAAQAVGFPLFLRTGQTSGKFQWEETCHVKLERGLLGHVMALCEYSELCCMMGLPYDVWVVRELLPTQPFFHTYAGMPVNKEFRVFVNDEVVECIHPYWPKDAIIKEMKLQTEGQHHEWERLICKIPDLDKRRECLKNNEKDHERRKIPPDFDDKYASLEYISVEQIGEITTMASKIGKAVGGSWSIDFLHTLKGWFVTDMATAEDSFHWSDCPNSEQQEEADDQ